VVAAAPLPEDFGDLVAEARRLDKTGHPHGREVWTAVLARAADNAADLDDMLRGEIAAELAHRAYAAKDWDEARRQFQAAAKHYEAAGRPARMLASEARDVWAEAVADPEADAVEAAEAAWPRLDVLLTAVEKLLEECSEETDPDRDTRRMVLVIRNSRVFVARNAGLLGECERGEAWAAVFKAEADALAEQAIAFGMPGRASLVYELYAEYDATHGEPVAAEASARRALEIFEAKEWPWRMHRGRLLLALALAGQKRYAEAVDMLRLALAEVYPGTEAEEITPLHRLLGDVAAQGRDHVTAVRAYSEAAVRLEREGSASAAVETRWRLSTVLFASGQVADAVAVLETLTDEAAEEVFDVAPVKLSGADDAGADDAALDGIDPVEAVAAVDSGEARDEEGGGRWGTPARTAELAVQIRLDLANGLARLGEYREAAYEYLRVAHVVGSWEDRTLLTFAAGGAARMLAFSGQWDGARLALQRALDSNKDAPFIAELSEVLRDLATAAVEDGGAEAAEEALGYVDAADRLRAEFPDAARDQFISVAFDEAQCLHARGKVLYVADRDEEAVAVFERAIAVFDAAGHATSPARFETVRAAAVVEMASLGRVDAGRARLDRAIAEAEAAGQAEGAVMLRQLRESR
jgi:tetratricopeptide (TPR) repeat protein